ncbi:hypothetical protein A3Q56_03087 [Intoshia linei]|uniref:EGF-like domain-containing protein n=1 Tax=Intoshia linei TaxID=1819745 RepID=A0A177B4F2_9BILA|nr:hypothetical protein A3Q56_03087 [Intoshia linei]
MNGFVTAKCGINNCTKCEKAINQCLDCKSNYYYNHRWKRCTKCVDNCNVCMNTQEYCSPNCNYCTNSSNCDECEQGYYYLIEGRQCIIQCPENCLKCKNENTCYRCEIGHYLKNNICKSTALIDSFINFLECSHKCQVCVSKLDCSTCVVNYYWNDKIKTCTLCDSNCAENHCDQYFGYCKSVNTISSNIECKRCGGIHSNYTLSSYWSQGTTCKFLKDTEGCIYSGVNVERLSSEKCERCENRYMNLPGDDICEEVVDCNNADWNPESSIHCAHYWDPYNLKCQPLDCDDQIRIDQEYKCNACNNRYWDTTRRKCLIVNCYNVDIILGTRYYNLCYGCRRLGFYWDVNFNQCRVIYDYNANCHTGQTIENICDMCEGHRWDGTSCVAVNCDGATDIENDEYRCKFCYGKEYILPGPVIAALPCTFGGNYYIDGCYGLVLNPGTSFFELNYQDIMGFCSVNEIVSRILGSHYWNGDECYFSETYHCNVYSNANHCNCMTRLFRPANVCIEMECNVSYLNDIGNTMVRKSATEYCATLKTGIHYNPGAELSKNSNCQNPGLIEVPDECNSCLGLVWEVDYCTVLVCSIQPLNTEDKCLGCDMFFKPISNTCYVCTANSINCNADGAECKDNYIFERKTWTCIECENWTLDTLYTWRMCDTCGPMITTASVYWDDQKNFCAECPMNCLLCDNGNTCNKCEDQRFEDIASGRCLSCIENCLECDTKNRCIQCQRGHFKNELKAPFTCDECSIGCEECESITQCSKCFESYCLNQHNQCSNTIGNCNICQINNINPTTVTCLYCNDKYTLKTCAPCPPECESCYDLYTCNSCKSSYFLESGKCKPCPNFCGTCASNVTCTDCVSKDMWYDNIVNECGVCAYKCIKCKDLFHCLICDENRYLLDGKCHECPNNCKECTAHNNCSKCLRNNMIYNSSTNKCTVCDQYCQSCKSVKLCNICEPSAFMTKTKPKQCSKCSTEIDNCNLCSRDWIDRVRCDECIAEFTPNKDKTKCIECGVGCKLCKYQKEMCTECAKSFHLSENSEQCGPKRCFSCDETEKSDCYYNAATYGLNGCIGDCMVLFSLF